MIVARTQPEADQSARIGHGFRLPAVIGLVAPHGVFAGLIPIAGCVGAKVVLADQRFLNCLRTLGINLLLAAGGGFMFAILAQTCLLRLRIRRCH